VDGDAGENALTVATVARSKKAVLETIMLLQNWVVGVEMRQQCDLAAAEEVH